MYRLVYDDSSLNTTLRQIRSNLGKHEQDETSFWVNRPYKIRMLNKFSCKLEIDVAKDEKAIRQLRYNELIDLRFECFPQNLKGVIKEIEEKSRRMLSLTIEIRSREDFGRHATQFIPLEHEINFEGNLNFSHVLQKQTESQKKLRQCLLTSNFCDNTFPAEERQLHLESTGMVQFNQSQREAITSACRQRMTLV